MTPVKWRRKDTPKISLQMSPGFGRRQVIKLETSEPRASNARPVARFDRGLPGSDQSHLCPGKTSTRMLGWLALPIVSATLLPAGPFSTSA